MTHASKYWNRNRFHESLRAASGSLSRFAQPAYPIRRLPQRRVGCRELRQHPPPMNRLTRLAPLLVFTIACAVFAQSVAYGFAGDDLSGIRDRVLFHDLRNWQEILTSSWWPHALYRPLTGLSLALNWVLAGGHPGVFHAVNLVLHGIVSVLVYRLARELFGQAAGLAAGLLFAVHPVHVEPVVNLVGRAEVLSALFGLGAVLLYRWDGQLADAADQGSWRRLTATLGTLVCIVLALGAKESAFAVPGLLLSMDWYEAAVGNRRLGDVVRRHSALWVIALAICVAWLFLRARIVQDLTGLEAAPGLEFQGLAGRAVIMLPMTLEYARLLFFPARLSVEYSPNFVPVSTELTLRGVAGAVLVLGAAILALVTRRRAPAIGLGVGWLAATLIIICNVLVPTGVLVAERTLYLASVGAVLLLAWVFGEVFRRAPSAAIAGLCFTVAGGGLRTVTRNPIWRDNDTYMHAMVSDAPGSFRAEWTEAEFARREGDLRGAEAHLRRAVQIHPLGWHVWRNLATLMYLEGRYPEAAQYFSAAWRINGGSAVDAQRAIQSHLQAGRLDSAATFLEAAVSKRPNMPVELTLAASDIAVARGDFLQAMSLRRRAAIDFPDSARYWALTGAAAAGAEQCPEVLNSLGRLRALSAEAALVAPLEKSAEELRCQ